MAEGQAEGLDRRGRRMAASDQRMKVIYKITFPNGKIRRHDQGGMTTG
jgi:hypothetical protein